MRFLSRNSGWLLSAVALTFALLVIAPAARTDEPPVFAITNARVIPVAGAPIEKGIVVLRNGIIEAVGTNVTIPADARIIDATGLTVYPGLIDALSDIGLEEPQPQAAVSPRAAGPPAATPQAQQPASAQSPDERQGLTPYRQAADLVSPANRKIESARNAGITTTLVAPRRGYFPGQSSLLNLSGSSVGRMIVKTPVAFHISLASRMGFGGDYPSSLMGVFAFVKQILMDAQQYSKAWSIYGSQPGAQRPEYSRALDALQPLVQQQMPVVLPGNTPGEIQRALDLAASFKLKLVLSGGAEAGKIGTMLRDRDVPVLLSAKFPERERDADPEIREELRELRRRVEAPASAAALAKAGVRFAFQSDDMANPSDFIRNVRRTVDAGLSREAALRALTLTPAEIFGVADRLGSIEKNKTANLILTTGDLFDSKTRVKWVFVDGQKFEIPESETPARPTEGGEAGPPTNVSGDWTLTVASPQGPMNVSAALRQSGNSLSGSVTSPLGTAQIQTGTVTGNSVTFRISVDIPGQGNLTVTFTGTVRGNSISGSADVGPVGKFDFTGSKSPGGF
jgi:imidazolonepropionase-like amidohydrolase